MNENAISVIDIASKYGMRKQTVFKVLARLGIKTVKRPGDHKTNRGQSIAYISEEDARLFAREIQSVSVTNRTVTVEGDLDAACAEQGVFYLLQLEPNHDPGRFKVGFATSLPERLRTLRCSAPFIAVLATWPCKNLWEKTAIDCVTQGCERLHTEIFRTECIDLVKQRCDDFFELMPKKKKILAGEQTLADVQDAGRDGCASSCKSIDGKFSGGGQRNIPLASPQNP